MSDPLLQARGLCRDFSGVRVLHDVDLDVHAGCILGVIGENGAGKSTLMKILAGVLAPTAGTLAWEGRRVAHPSPQAARRLGIALIPQELQLAEDLTAGENVFLGREGRRAGVLLDHGAMRARVRQLMAELRTDIAPEADVRRLGVAERQMVEIARALAEEARLLILDEPTAVLSGRETEVLFDVMRRLRARGAALLYISHRLREVRAICDEVLVLRDGHVISRDPAGRLDERELARRMVGRDVSQVFPPRAPAGAGSALRVERLSVPGRVCDVSLDVRQGEILGLAGLVGAGRTELAEALMGLRRHTGRVLLAGREVVVRRPADALAAGLAYLPEDRQAAGVLGDFSVAENITLNALPRYGRWLVDRRRQADRAADRLAAFRVKAPGVGTPVRRLSGGNQQKVALAKALDTDPRVVILDEPTRGIDVQARRDLYELVAALVARGVACLLISSDLEEILGLSHRVAVMRGGRLAGVLEGDRISDEAVMFLATGAEGERSVA